MVNKTSSKANVRFSTIILVTLIALLLIPCKVSAAAFVADTDNNGALNIDESQINVNISKYKDTEVAFTATYDATTKMFKSSSFNTPLLGRMKITMNIKGRNLLSTELANMVLNVQADNTANGATKVGQERDFPVASVERQADGSFNVISYIISYGSKISFKTSALNNNPSNVSVAYGSSIGQNGSMYYIIKTSCSGDNLFVSIPVDATISTAKYTKWAKRICVYLNSLKDVTGLSKGTSYIVFDNEYEPGYGCSDKLAIDAYGYHSPLIAYKTGATPNILNYIRAAENKIDWIELHELSHSYCYQATNVSNNFYAYYNYNDEVHTNVRGLTAIQNCDNLRNILVRCGDVSNTYDKILDTCGDTSVLFDMAKKYVDLAKKYGWNIMETFFKAESDYYYDDKIDAINAFKEYTGLTFDSRDPDHKRFINCYYKLYMLSWYQSTFNKYSFFSFLDQEFGKDRLINFMYDQELI